MLILRTRSVPRSYFLAPRPGGVAFMPPVLKKGGIFSQIGFGYLDQDHN